MGITSKYEVSMCLSQLNLDLVVFGIFRKLPHIVSPLRLCSNKLNMLSKILSVCSYPSLLKPNFFLAIYSESNDEKCKYLKRDYRHVI